MLVLNSEMRSPMLAFLTLPLDFLVIKLLYMYLLGENKRKRKIRRKHGGLLFEEMEIIHTFFMSSLGT